MSKSISRSSAQGSEDADFERLLDADDEELDELDDLLAISDGKDDFSGLLALFMSKDMREARKEARLARIAARTARSEAHAARSDAHAARSGTHQARSETRTTRTGTRKARAARRTAAVEAKTEEDAVRTAARRTAAVEAKTEEDATETVASSTLSGFQPIFEPQHNFREVSKQLCLLEDHLEHPSRRCNDCIAKHLLVAEALADEAASIDKTGKHVEEAHVLSGEIRSLAHDVSSGMNRHQVAQRARQIRKRLVKRHFGALDKESIGTVVESVGSAGTSEQKVVESTAIAEQNRQTEPFSQIQGERYGKIKRRYVQAIVKAAERGDVQRARQLRVHARRRLGELRTRMVTERHFGRFVDATQVTWSTSKAKEIAAKLFLQAADETPSQSVSFKNLAHRVQEGLLYQDLSSPAQMMADVVRRTKTFAPKISADAQQLYESASKAEKQGRVAPQSLDLSKTWTGNEVVIVADRKTYPSGPVLGWFRGTVMLPKKGQEVEGRLVHRIPVQGWLPIFYVDTQVHSGFGSRWVPVQDVVRVKDNPISKTLRSKSFQIIRNGNNQTFSFTDPRLAMADLIESVILDRLGDICAFSKVANCQSLSADRRYRIAEKIVWAALVNAVYESELNPAAVGSAKEVGLFQLHPKYLGKGLTDSQKIDPVLNTKIIVDELKRVFNTGRFLSIMQREVTSPTGIGSPNWMEWAEAFTIEVERPYNAVRKGRLRAWTLANFFGLSQRWLLPGTAPVVQPVALPVVSVQPVPSAPSIASPPAPKPQQASFLSSLLDGGWQKPTLFAGGLLLGVVAVRAAMEATSASGYQHR